MSKPTIMKMTIRRLREMTKEQDWDIDEKLNFIIDYIEDLEYRILEEKADD